MGTTDSHLQAKNVHLISLGCARNRVDSEVMLGSLGLDGWNIVDEPEESDAVVINTCGFIDVAKEESVQTILDVAELKQANDGMKLVVAGCLTQRYKNQLVKGFPEVDLFVGTDEFHQISDFLRADLPKGSLKAKRTDYLYNSQLPKTNTLTSGSAYVKVAEGCQHQCSFCIIPAIRGPLRSRPIQDVVREVEELAAQGVKEVNLIAQDLAAYGRDSGEMNLLDLLKRLVLVNDIEWIRLLYVYPENISDEFLEFWANQPKIAPYIDIPVQHGSTRVLKDMKRDICRDGLIEVIKKVRQKVPSVAIRTSVMVGFPGETEEDFEALKKLVEEVQFDHLGCFEYSQEEGTVAGRMSDQIPEEVKAARCEEIMDLQKAISNEKLRSYVGKTVPVLVKGLSEESDLLFEGRTPWQAPEVDGIVYINDGEAIPGTIQKLRITESHDYDLVGSIVRE